MEGIIPSPSLGENEVKTRAYYIDNMQVGNVVAFTVDTVDGQKMLSGRVLEIRNETVTIQTKNGSIFFPKKGSIVWVRTGTRWPVGIYNALKFTKKGI